MHFNTLRILLLACLMPLTAMAQSFVNLTPKPKQMTTVTGTITLPTDFKVSYSDIDEEMQAEVARFVADFNAATGYAVTMTEGDTEALVQVATSNSPSFGSEGYLLASNTGDLIRVQAKSALGLYYAFQSFKKMLPANVMAGVRDEAITSYELPRVYIMDEPRFEYRGFMLDVSRHFFTVEEVKRMLDVMAYYKMNRFHWHLSDDQGWRVEIKKYPRLTTVGSIAPNVMFTDMYTCSQYWLNKPYGPYFYTQEQIKEVVAYAKEKHIEIVPEIDMPGHFVAAMAAYPEYSCTPNGNHTVWVTGGISNDVMNVANPEAVQFAKDILAELIDLFPYETIHIGGDECPTTAWEGNALCQQRYAALGLTNYRQLQSHFIKQMADFVQSKGRKLAVWNEAITAGSADVETVQSTDALVYCWTGPEAAARKAASLGLKNIYTPWGPYYINRKQGNSDQDPPGAGDGSDHVKKTYNTTVPAETDYGVQGTFWCEHVSDRDYLEWLALPRLIAIAESGWTPAAQKNWEDFQQRMTADTLLLNYGGYKYCKYYMLGQEEAKVMPKANTAENKYYYRIISGGTDAARVGRCIELLSATSPLLTEYANKGALEGRLWTNNQAADGDDNYDYQWWSLEESPTQPGLYALVCKALPDGSINASPTNSSTGGRWTYDNAGKHYDFALGTNGYGTIGNNYYYSISSSALSGYYFNSSMPGQGLAVNVYTNPGDGRGGYWEFSPMENYDTPNPGESTEGIKLEAGKTYRFTNAVDGYDHTAISDDGTTALLNHSTDPFAATAWTATSVTDNEDGTQSVKLKNVVTGRSMAAASGFTARVGRQVAVNAVGTAQTFKYVPATEAYRLVTANGGSFFPLPSGAISSGANTAADAAYDAPRLAGAEWNVEEVRLVTLSCRNAEGADLGTFHRSIPVNETDVTAALCPALPYHSVAGIEDLGDDTFRVTYQKTAYKLLVRCQDEQGAIISEEAHAVPLGESYTFTAPAINYYTKVSSSVAEGAEVTPDDDATIITAVYSTHAITGIAKLGDLVTEPEEGQLYAIYDASTDDGGARAGYRTVKSLNANINRVTAAEGASPATVWVLEKSGERYKVKNNYYNLYVPELSRSAGCTLSADAGLFTLSLNSDGQSYKITGSNGMMWDGVATGDLVGWNTGAGHPIKFYRIWASPFFRLTIRCVDTKGAELAASEKLLQAGEAYSLITPVIEGYVVNSVSGNESLHGVMDNNYDVVVTYKSLVDAIDQVEVDQPANGVTGIYDLSGRRHHHIATPGLYIVNGKKVLVK